jgi:undecaprenyl-diphosphatase
MTLCSRNLAASMTGVAVPLPIGPVARTKKPCSTTIALSSGPLRWSLATRAPVLFESIKDVSKLILITTFAYFAISTFARRRQRAWSQALIERRFALLALLALAVVGIKLTEDVVNKESGSIDESVLLFVHNSFLDRFTGFFEALTLSGSGNVLIALATAATLGLLWTRRRFEAGLVATAVGSAGALIYLIKRIVDRERPDLWETQWYWGSSFPSGHTLATAAFATALFLCAVRIWPNSRAIALPVALLWVTLVGLSRLVLGVHWPTDVATAACLGAFLPIAITLGYDLHLAHRNSLHRAKIP